MTAIKNPEESNPYRYLKLSSGFVIPLEVGQK